MIHPHTELRQVSPEVGLGVVATRFIPRGTILWIDCPLDQKLTPQEVASLAPEYRAVLDRYGYPDLQGRTVLCWDHGRFVNHSCDPSAASGPLTQCEVALKDIHPGEQFTCEYLEIRSPDTFPCQCGAATCRGMVRWEDREQVEARLHSLVEEVLPLIAEVEQPLAAYAKHLPEVQALVAGEPLSRPTLKEVAEAAAKNGAAKGAKNGAAKGAKNGAAKGAAKNGAAKKTTTRKNGAAKKADPVAADRPRARAR
ncbi:MAG: SET domain-containing protein [Planctomycetota bacterium]